METLPGATQPDSFAGTLIETPPSFPVHWDNPEDERLLWTLDRVHWPRPMPPLVFAIAGDAVGRGLAAAARAYELPIADVRMAHINGYRYQANVPLDLTPAEAAARRERSHERLRAAIGRLDTLWSVEWLPEIQEHLKYWESFDLESVSKSDLVVHLQETLARADRLWEIHFLLASPMHGAISEFGKLHFELFGGSKLDAYRLLTGFDNKIMRAARALWQLSRQAVAVEPVQRVLKGTPPTEIVSALRTFPEGQAFLVDLRAYLEEYGQRGEGLSLDHPSWLEDPTSVIENLQGYMAQPDRDLAAEMAASTEGRDLIVAEARRRLAGYPAPVRDEFEFLLNAAQHAVVLSEDHNFWIDARGMYQVRCVFLEFGKRLAGVGAIECVDDVFYLTPTELADASGNLSDLDLRELVAARRGEMERFGLVDPPPALGTRPATRRASRSATGAHAVVPDLIWGSAGSTGIARGPARIAHSLEEAGRLQRGEVLVAQTLSSSWTPLFATAVAVVTDTGGILSHAAVVAREYGIPAVLGTSVATAMVHEGQPLEVDGQQGTVRMLDTASPVPAVAGDGKDYG